MRVVEMNSAAGIDGYERSNSPTGQPYYWPAGNGMVFTHTAPESDVEALYEGYLTVTPLSYVLTDRERFGAWKDRLHPTPLTAKP